MSDQDNRFNNSLLDHEQLQMLIEAGASESTELFKEILELFEEESDRKLVELQEQKVSRDFENMSRSAHALAGSSANIGGREVWLQAKEIENLCKSGKGPKAVELLPRLVETYHQTIVAMKAYAAELD